MTEAKQAQEKKLLNKAKKINQNKTKPARLKKTHGPVNFSVEIKRQN